MPLTDFRVKGQAGGKAQYDPRLMLGLLIYCYANGVFSSRRIERATWRDVGVRYVAANLHEITVASALVGVGALSITFTAWDLLPQPFGRGSPALGSVLTVVYLYFLQQTLFVDRLLDINELLGKVVVLSAFVLLLSAIHMLLTVIGVEQRQVVTVVAFVLLLLYEPLDRKSVV